MMFLKYLCNLKKCLIPLLIWCGYAKVRMAAKLHVAFLDLKTVVGLNHRRYCISSQTYCQSLMKSVFFGKKRILIPLEDPEHHLRLGI